VGFTEPSGAGHAAVRNRTTKRYRDVAVAGRWYFPAPSLTLRVAALAFEVFRRRRAGTDPPLRKNRNRADPRVLAPLQSSHCCPGRTRPPLVGFVRRCVSKPQLALQPRHGRRPPLHRLRDAQARLGCSPTERPLPHALPRASVSRNHPRNPVPSSWFHTTSTVSSARRSRACCIPLPVMGFVAFLGAGFPIPDLASQIAAGGPNPSSRRTFTPPEGTLDCSRTTSPWPLPPCRQRPVPLGSSLVTVAGDAFGAPPDRSVDFEALLRRRVRTPRDRCRSSGALSFHGLCSPSRSFLPNKSTPAPARCTADDENPKTTVRISDKLRSASTASLRCGPRPDSLARARLGGDTNDWARRPKPAPPGTRHRHRSEERHRPGCAAQPEG